MSRIAELGPYVGYPMIRGIRVPGAYMCCTFRLYKGGGNNVWVATAIGSNSTAWNLIKQRFARYIKLYWILQEQFDKKRGGLKSRK